MTVKPSWAQDEDRPSDPRQRSLLPLGETAEILGVSTSTLRKWIQDYIQLAPRQVYWTRLGGGDIRPGPWRIWSHQIEEWCDHYASLSASKSGDRESAP